MRSPTKLRILYLEDDPDSREMVTFMLAPSNIEVVTANNPVDAWRLTTTQSFDLYLLDCLVSGTNCLDLCRKLREYAPLAAILFYSGLASKADIERGLAAGANGYLVKPYFGDLAKTVLRTIRKVKTTPVLFSLDRTILADFIPAAG